MPRATMRRAFSSLASLLVVIPTIAIWQQTGLPAPLKALAGVMLILTAVKPKWGLFALMGALPLATPIQVLTSAPTDTAVAELLVIPFLLAAGVRLALQRTTPPSRLARPAAVLGLIVAASTVVVLAVEQQATAWPSTYVWNLWHNLLNEYVIDPLPYLPHIAMAWMEGLVLAVWAERLIRAEPDIGSPATRMALTGIAAAAAFSALRLTEISLRAAHPLSAAAHFLMTQRITPLFRDLNAAGSYFALATVPVLWLAVRRGGRPWARALSPVVLLALWLSGSRAALAATVCGLTFAWFVSYRPSRRTLIGVGALALGLAAMVTINPGRYQATVESASSIRLELADLSLRMAATHPVFGVGLGQFQRLSKTFISAALLHRFPLLAKGENAHNNFLQILAELGGVGLLAFVGLVGVPAGAFGRAVAAEMASAELVGLAGGLVAFLGTCLLGHPFLTVPVLLAFLLVLGLAAGLTPASPAPSRLSGGRLFSYMAVAAILVSVPFRARAARRAADLDHVSIGASGVLGAVDDVRYRLADTWSVWFVATQARVVEIPLRVSPESPANCQVAIAIDRRPADVVSPPPDSWLRVSFTLPRPAPGVGSRRFDLRVSGESCHLMVGAFDLRE